MLKFILLLCNIIRDYLECTVELKGKTERLTERRKKQKSLFKANHIFS